MCSGPRLSATSAGSTRRPQRRWRRPPRGWPGANDQISPQAGAFGEHRVAHVPAASCSPKPDTDSSQEPRLVRHTYEEHEKCTNPVPALLISRSAADRKRTGASAKRLLFFNHYDVANLDETAAFFQRALGLKLTAKEPAFTALKFPNGDILEVLRRIAPRHEIRHTNRS